MSERQRVFFDTSVWIAAILSDRGASFYLLDSALSSRLYDVISSLDVFEEGIETLTMKYTGRRDDFKELFHRVHPTLVQPSRLTLRHAVSIVHPDDAPILAGAIESKSDALVTLDKKHFLSSADDIFSQSGIVVTSPGQFLQKVRSLESGSWH